MAVTLDQIALRLRVATPDPASREALAWQQAIDTALLLIRHRLGDAAFAALDQQVLDYVVLEAVVEHLRNPTDSATEVQVQVDDASTTRRYSTALGRVAIWPELWAMLTPGSGDVSTVQMVGEPDSQWWWIR